MYKVYRSCPICNGTDIEKLHRQRFELPEGHPLSNGYDVVICNICGFVYANTSATQADYDRFYAEQSKYEDIGTGTGGITNPFDWKRQQDTARQINEFIQNPKARILDVGCANGGLLKALKDLGYRNLLGIDPSAVCVKNTRALGIEAQVGSLSEPIGARFDCVILSHTLEHVQNIEPAAIWIRNSMKEDAIIYIEVPDASRYADFVDAPFQDFNTEHINHFSLTSLKNYLHTHHFESVEWGEKVIPASVNKPYPAIFCFARKSDKTLGIDKDTKLRNEINRYISLSQNILDDIEMRLKKSLANSNRVIIWGVGQLAMKLLAETSLANAQIVAFVDSNPMNQGKILRGLKIISPESVIQFTEPILISSTLHQQSIVEQIQKMGLNNSIILLRD